MIEVKIDRFSSRNTVNSDSEEDSREILKLSKRTFEFQGSIQVLLSHPENINSIYANLKTLNLYDNALENLNGIGILAHTPLEEVNLGRNRLNSLPAEV